MQIAKVRGTVVSTHKDPSLRGSKFLLLQILDEEGNPSAEYEVAADAVGAGVGEWVLVTRGSAARQVLDGEKRPLDALIVAIIDTVTVNNNCSIYSKRDEDR